MSIRIITDDVVKHALEVLKSPDRPAAKARAAHEFMAKQEKVVKARLMGECNEKSAAMKERYALAHSDYLDALNATRVIAEQDYSERERRDAAKAIIDAWRTEQSNERAHARG